MIILVEQIMIFLDIFCILLSWDFTQPAFMLIIWASHLYICATIWNSSYMFNFFYVSHCSSCKPKARWGCSSLCEHSTCILKKAFFFLKIQTSNNFYQRLSIYFLQVRNSRTLPELVLPHRRGSDLFFFFWKLILKFH